MTFKTTLLVVGHISLLLLVCSVVIARPCTDDDYTGTYTQCEDNYRNLIWYWKAGVNCSEGVQLPANQFGLRCDLACGEGYYLPLGATECSPCPPGSFSTGGGHRITDWTNDIFGTVSQISNFQVFRTYCERNNRSPFAQNLTLCSGWNVSTDGSYIFSGSRVGNSQNSVLELLVYLVTDGHVHFEYRVLAEINYDGLIFQADGQTLLSLVSDTTGYVSFKTDLTKGFHTLRWIYSKDISLSYGADAAFIRMLEVGGTEYALNECTPCPTGTFSEKAGEEECLLCDVNTYSNETGRSDICLPCPDDQFSYEGAVQCITRLPCTTDDYIASYSDCFGPGGHRNKTYVWKSPMICNSVTGVSLPAAESMLRCPVCPPGTFRSPSTYQCEFCQGGYAGGGQSVTCALCPAGTAATKEIHFMEWTKWPPGFTAYCSQDCTESSGWRLNDNSIDTGLNYGRLQWAVLDYTVELEAAGSVSFNYTLSCNGSCGFQFSSIVPGGHFASHYLPSNSHFVSYPLDAGNNTLEWRFIAPYNPAGGLVRAIVTQITVTGVKNGGASKCIDCSPGSYSGHDASTFCKPCDPGSFQRNNRSSSCGTCTANSFTDRPGMPVCIPCGTGTYALPNATGCSTNCIFSPKSGIIYDLSPLKKTNSSWGPIVGTLSTNYFINVCSRTHSDGICEDADDEDLNTYGCRYSRFGGSTDIGRVMSFLPRSPDPTSGVIMNLAHGDIGCGGTVGNTTVLPFERQTNVTFICDPLASPPEGFPEFVSSSNCLQNFLWRSLYGCPLCSSAHYTYVLGQCINGRQSKVYFWTQNPKMCHDGEGLPEEESIVCEVPTVACKPGQYFNDGNCTVCDPGYYSVGGGFEIKEWAELPEGFTTSCMENPCNPWQTQLHSIMSGKGVSMLTFSSNFTTTGSVEFKYKIYTNAKTDATFYFTVDRLVVLEGKKTLELDYQSFTYDQITPGFHTLEWTFHDDSSNPVISMYIESVKILGTTLSATQCMPCPGGTFANSTGAAECQLCPRNSYSIGAATTCTPCKKREYSLPGSNFCASQSSCTTDDFQDLFTPCVNNKRTHYLMPLQPYVCVLNGTVTKGGVSLTRNQTVDCAPCADNMYRPNNSSKCVACPNPGTYLNVDNECVKSVPGYAVYHSISYFSDNSLNDWPEGWYTGCTGACGTSGWRMLGSSIDSGNHEFDNDVAVDSFVGWNVTLTVDGSISFRYSLPGINPSAVFEFYIDNVPMAIPLGYASYELLSGNHSLLWNYHQYSGTSRDAVALSNVKLIGTVTGGTYLQRCPSGTHTASVGATFCQPCSPGHYAMSDGSTQCLPCAKDQIAPDFGASFCTYCGTGTHTDSEASTQCINTCQFNVENGPIFSLKDTPTIRISDGDGQLFMLNLCNGFHNVTDCSTENGEQIDTFNCGIDNMGHAYDFGNFLTFVPNTGDNINNGFSLRYTNGEADDICDQGRNTIITFACADLQNDPQYLPTSSMCDVSFLWVSLNGCPVCTDEDYKKVVSDCDNGELTTAYIRDKVCNGPASKVGPSESCSRSVSFPVWGAILVAVVLVATIAIAIVFYVRGRRASQAYYRLIQQNNKHIELQDSNSNERSTSEFVIEDEEEQTK